MPLANIQMFTTHKLRICARPAAIAAGLICAALVPGSAAARPDGAVRLFSWDPTEVVRQAKVDYSDLDLETTQGAQTLLTRIGRASKAVCGDEPAIKTLREQSQLNDCRVTALKRAVRKVENPLLTSLASDQGRMLVATQ